MIAVISPAKRLDFSSHSLSLRRSSPSFSDKSEQLVARLRQLSALKLGQMMGLSEKLANLNHARFQVWEKPTTRGGAKQAIHAFKGDVYMGLDAENFDDEDLSFANKHLFILSGLHGVLRALDLILPYRLEMGTRFADGSNLYEFWDNAITNFLNRQTKGDDEPTLINLASAEYFKSIKADKLKARVITPVFKEWRQGTFKVISFAAKRARGLMSRYIVRKRINEPQPLRDFKENGYAHNPELSSGDTWAFTRA